jgi:gentisate 1,2-dioxygenase
VATDTYFSKPGLTPERTDFYARLGERSTAPLWEVLGKLVATEPRPQTQPVLWHYDSLRPLLMEAGRLLTAEEAERRVLVLENPGLRGRSQVTGSLFAGLQLILPGEVARCHRHVASALRFIIEGRGAYTSVEGERTEMSPGDFILTPSWMFHDHGNAGDQPVVWLDGLDVPMVNMFDTSFAGHPGPTSQPAPVEAGASRARYGANMLPVDYTPATSSSPVFSYPYSRSREVLDVLARTSPLHPCHGAKTRFVNPVTGGHPMPTIAAFMQLLPAGFDGQRYRATDATVYSVVEGEGTTTVGETRYAWGPRDIFVIPSWAPVSHHATRDAVLFSMSDRAAQQALGLWREEAPMTT